MVSNILLGTKMIVSLDGSVLFYLKWVGRWNILKTVKKNKSFMIENDNLLVKYS